MKAAPIARPCAADLSPESLRAIAVAGLAPMLAAVPIIMALSPATIGVVVSLYALGWLAIHHQHLAWRVVWNVPMSLVVLSVVLLGLLSATWAVDSALALNKALKFGLVCLPLVWVAALLTGLDKPVERYAKAVLVGCLLGALLLAMRTFGDGVLRTVFSSELALSVASKTNVPAAALAILAWLIPQFMADLPRPWRVLGASALVLIGISVFAGDGSAPRVAFVVGGLMSVGARIKPRLCAIGLAVAVVLTHALAPHLLSLPTLSDRITDRSLQHRIEIWALAGDLIAERPLLGFGFSNSGRIPAQAGVLPLTGERRAVPLYPHNVLLQAQLELGVPGVVLFYGCLGYLLWRLLDYPPAARAAGLAVVAAALSVWCVGYPLWRSTWIAWLLFVAIALNATIPRLAFRACRGS